MTALRNSLLATTCIVGFAGAVYYPLPGYDKLFTGGTGPQPTGIFLCATLFLIGFTIAVIVSPGKAQFCPQCGCNITKKRDEIKHARNAMFNRESTPGTAVKGSDLSEWARGREKREGD